MTTGPPAFTPQLQSYPSVFSARGRGHVERQMHHFKMKPGWLSSRVLWFNLGSGGLPRLSNEDRLPGTEGQKSQARLVLNTFSCSIQLIILFFS